MKKHTTNNHCQNKTVTASCPPPESVCETETAAETCNCPCENRIKISGKVMYNGQAVHLATVVVIRNRQVIAECLTDCDGCYEFTGERAKYFLRAHKNRLRSRARSIPCTNGDKFQANFNLM